MNHRNRRTAQRLMLYALVLLIIVVFGFPLYWMVVTSITPITMIFDTPPHVVPVRVTLDNYVELFQRTKFPSYTWNSMIVTFGAVALTTIVSTTSGYALRRYHIPQKKNIIRLILFSYMYPEMLFAIPYYVTFYRLHLLNSYLGLILAHVGYSLPLGVWLMWMFFQTIPNRFEECAWTLGAGRLRSIFEIAIRLALPGAVAVAIFTFAVSWSDYSFALILWSGQMKNVPVALDSFVVDYTVHWGLMQAGSVCAVLPPFILIILLQKYVLEGFSLRGT